MTSKKVLETPLDWLEIFTVELVPGAVPRGTRQFTFGNLVFGLCLEAQRKFDRFDRSGQFWPILIVPRDIPTKMGEFDRFDRFRAGACSDDVFVRF